MYLKSITDKNKQMPDIRKALTLDTRDEYFEIHLSLINCILPASRKMTATEIKVLASFMSLEGDLAAYRFGATAKKIVMAKLKLSPSGMSNYITALMEKELIKKVGDAIMIWPLLQPQDNKQVYMFKLKM